MAEYYRHYLIPTAPEFRPDMNVLSQFLRGLVESGNVPINYSFSFSKVTKSDSPSRVMANPFTGETVSIQGPSRQLGKAQALESMDSLRESTESADEFDVSMSSEGIPQRPPLQVGYVQDTSWIPMLDPYHQEVICRVRSHTVCLSQLRSVDDWQRPLDLTNSIPPIFDEDCSAEDCHGIFVHPDAGPIKVVNAGCAMFWIEFNYGKFLYPQLQDGGVNFLDSGVVSQAKSKFGTDFVQACSWG